MYDDYYDNFMEVTQDHSKVNLVYPFYGFFIALQFYP